MFNRRPSTRINNYRCRYKLIGFHVIVRWAKYIVLCSLLLTIVIIFLHCQKINRLSAYRDLGKAKAEALNNALNRLPTVEEARDTWKVPRVDGAAIFSAYLDTRPEVVLEENADFVANDTAWAMIRIIAVIPTKLESTIPMCYYRYISKNTPNETHTLGKRAIAIHLAASIENFGMKYSAAFVLCELPGRENGVDDLFLPIEVTIASDVQERPSEMSVDEFVAIHYPKTGWKNFDPTKIDDRQTKIDDRSIAVCVQPLHHDYDRAIDLVAFVEYYRFMGVKRFTFYRDSTTQRVNEILDYYARENIVKVIEWHLPKMYIFEINLRVDGIFAALNDCLYRSTFHDRHSYVAGIDVDEYIVPRKHDNLDRLMEHLNPRMKNVDDPRYHGAWIFRNMFFYLMHPDDKTTLAPGLPKLKLHTKTLRWREVNWAHDRSKYIVKGRDTIDLGNHQVWKMKGIWSYFSKRYEEITVDPEIAASQHYRECETSVDKCWKRQTILDRTAHRFTDPVARRVAYTLNKIFPSSMNSSAVK